MKNVSLKCIHECGVMFGAFMGQALSVGFYFSFGPIYVEILRKHKDSVSIAAWIGSFGYSFCFLLGIFTSICCDKIGCGIMMSAGGAFLGLGVLLSSFAPNTMYLFLTYGVVVSIGASCLFFSSLLCLPLYFNKRLGMANGIASMGSSIGGIIFPPFFAVLIKNSDLKTAFQTFAIFAIVPMLGGFLIRRKPIDDKFTATKKTKSIFTKCCDRSLLKNKAFILYTAAMTLILFVYYIPYVHLANFAVVRGQSRENAALLFSIISAMSAVGKITLGCIGTKQGVNKLYLFQGNLLLLSVSLTLLPLAESYVSMVMFAVVFGFGEGGFCSYIIIVCGRIVFNSQLAVAFGMMYSVTSIFSLLGPPFAAILFKASGSYETAFISGGAVLMVGAVAFFLVPLLVPTNIQEEKIEHKTILRSITAKADKEKDVDINEEKLINSEEICIIVDDVNVYTTDETEKSLSPLKKSKSLGMLLPRDYNKYFEENCLHGSFVSLTKQKGNLRSLESTYLETPSDGKLNSLITIPPFASQHYIEKYIAAEKPTEV